MIFKDAFPYLKEGMKVVYAGESNDIWNEKRGAIVGHKCGSRVFLYQNHTVGTQPCCG